MPHPEHAVDALTGSADGLKLFVSAAAGARMSKHRELGLTDYEYDLIVEKMGREPNEVELAVFSLMWSEHCGYKHSRPLLKTLPTEGPRLVLGPGENAGAVDVGDGLACAFKVESHNHPSAVEPFQGAATGVGGILRDIFAIGARPIAILDSLRFGEVADSARSRYLLEHAVAGIGHYGNSIGIATVGGEIYFEGPYEQNCLVNAMAVGLIETDKLIKSAAAGVGNVVVLFGARTGRDGIGGASVLASRRAGLRQDKRPTVQIGDPFEEKKLLECSLELLDRKLLVALQDLGAAGLTSSSAEMAAKGEVGLDLDVRRVPLREQDMEPFEIMISESQERMLCVVEPDARPGGAGRLRRWEVNATAIGEVTDTRRLRVFDGEELVGDLPVDGARRRVPGVRPRARRARDAAVPGAAARPGRREDPGEILLGLLGSANLASRKCAFEQYDALVGSRTVRRPEQADAAVLLLPDPANGDKLTALSPSKDDDGPKPAIAMSIDGNGRRVAADPYRGAVEAVLECSANLACVGAEPLGLTNCLNFGNPEKPHIAWQFSRAIAGLGDACRAFGIPVVGGNVSLYNEGGEGPIYPTPVVGLVGELPDARKSGRLGFQHAGDAIAIVAAELGAVQRRLGALEAARRARRGPAPARRAGRAQGAPRRDPPGRPLRRAVTPRTTWPRAASRSRWPSPRSPAAWARRCPASRRAVRRRPGRVRRLRPGRGLTAFGAAARVIGEVGGDALSIEGALYVAARRPRPRLHARFVRPPGINRAAWRRRGHEPLRRRHAPHPRTRPLRDRRGAPARRDPAGELDVESGCVDGEPIADWIDRFSRIAPQRIIADLVASRPRDAATLLAVRRRAGRSRRPGAGRTRRDPRRAAGDRPLPRDHAHVAARRSQDVLSAIRVFHMAFS